MRLLLGSDEVGLGAIAGPLVVCAFACPEGWTPPQGLKDSKQLSPRQREKLFVLLHSEMLRKHTFYCALKRSALAIDVMGVQKVLVMLHRMAIQNLLATAAMLGHEVKEVITDGKLPIPGALSVPKADSLYPHVSAASVIAKFKRDAHMQALHYTYPNYCFDEHKGYPTSLHLERLREYGVSKEHRKSYAPVRAIWRPENDEARGSVL